MPKNPNEMTDFDDPFAPNEMNPDDEKKKSKKKKADEDLKDGQDEKKRKGLWLTDEELTEVKENIEAAIKYQKSDDRWEHWHEYLDYINCRWDSIHDDDDGEPCNVNSIFSNLQVEIPTLYFQHPHVNVFAKRPSFKREKFKPGMATPVMYQVDNIQGAKLLEVRLNNVFDDINIEPIIERGVVDALAPYGYAVWKVGYGFNTEFEPDLNQEVTKTTYWVRRVDPRNVLIDPLASSFNDREFTVERIARKKKHLLRNQLYLKEEIEKLKPGTPEIYKKRLDGIEGYKPKLIEFFEYHDHVNKTIHWVVINKGKAVEIRQPLKVKNWMEGSDFVFLDLNVATDDNVYPLSDIEPVIDQAKARNRIRTAQTKHIENWGISVFVESDFWISEEEEEVFRRSGNGVNMYKVRNNALRENGMEIVPAPAIPRDLYTMDEVYKRDNDETLGITDAQKGQTTGDTKAEVLTVNNAANIRISRRRRKVKLAIIEIAKKLAALIRANDDSKTVLNVSGKMDDDDFIEFLKKEFKDFNPEVPFLEVDKQSWQGDYNFNFELEEMLERPKAVQIQQLLNTVNQLSTHPIFLEAHAKVMDPAHVIRKAYELQGMKVEDLKKQKLTPEIPDDMENEMAERGVQIPDPHEKNNHPQHIFKHLALVREMQAKLPLLLQAAIDPQTGQPKDMEALEAYMIVKRAIQILQEHVVKHYQMDQANEAKAGGQPMATRAQPNINGGTATPPASNLQTPGAEAGTPTEFGIQRNSGAI